ncbi:hypothetical protein [Micromonospora sp. NBC_01796]|uniref:hypothetical protein n=1 Tax=Micromonospora sp. NBC_01796 TaxID=2975987 RepID=UPI002DD9F370|nr:hypothetical protein [Micromonospora sp. NBC_01796]WSA88079.1 hypothetical protein OIE47_10970 [Micromonospora sp. NBC_01796]
MGNYDDLIQVPIAGQPVSKSQYGDPLRDAIIELDSRTDSVEAAVDGLDSRVAELDDRVSRVDDRVTDVDSRLDAVETLPVCIVLRSAAQPINSGGSGTNVEFTADEIDSHGMFTPGTSTTNLVIPSTGVYAFTAYGVWSTGAAGVRSLAIVKAGTTLVEQKRPTTNQGDPVAGSIERLASAGEVITLRAFHTLGAALNIQAVSLSVRKVRP